MMGGGSYATRRAAAMAMRHSIAGSRDAKRRTVGKLLKLHQSGLTQSMGLF
jgi:hypothetical protein